MVKVGIIGGGISGLTSAYYLHKAVPTAQIKIFESQNKVGGWIDSYKTNCICEKGPRSIRGTNKRVSHVLSILENIGLTDELIHYSSNSPSAQQRYICLNDKLHLVPSRISSFFQKNPPFTSSLLKKSFGDIFYFAKDQDVSVDQFFRSRFGNEVADYFISALCRGIFGTSSLSLSMKSTFPDIYWSAIKSGKGSVIRGLIYDNFFAQKGDESVDCDLARRCVEEKWAAFSFTDGLGQFPKTLSAYLERECGVQCSLNSSVKSISLNQGDSVKLGFEGGKTETFDHVISSIYSFNLGDVIDAGPHKEFVDLLKSVQAVDLAVVDVGFRGVKLPYNGFGYLVPECESTNLYGVTFDSRIFPSRQMQHEKDGTEQLSCFFGGDILFGDNVEKKIEKSTLSYLEKHLGIKIEPASLLVNLKRKCIPLYSLGHSTCVEKIYSHVERMGWPLTLVGASFNHVDIPGIVCDTNKIINRLVNDKFTR